jgi:hypothetical protein
MDTIESVAEALPVGLHSRGVCPMCLFLLLQGGPESFVVPTLWIEGMDEPVREALEDAVRRDMPGASAALDDLQARGCRSAIFRAVVRRLARELDESARRAYAASLN